MKVDKINVLITGVGGGGHGTQALKALKLSSGTYSIIGTDISQESFGLSLADKGYIVPSADHPDYIKKIGFIVRENNVKAMICGSDPELLVISRERKFFSELGVILLMNSDSLICTCMNKFKTMQLLRDNGFTVPQSFLVKNQGNLKKISTFPVICKPNTQAGGSANVFIAQDKDELKLLSTYLLSYLHEFLIQEYIGTPDDEYTVGVLSDLNGKLIDSIAVKRTLASALSRRIKVPNRTKRDELGKTLMISSGISQGQIGRFPKITRYCEKVALAIGSRGPINFQCRVNKMGIFIFEINPRFSGTTPLRALAGFNEPDLLIKRHIFKKTLSRQNYQEGIILRELQEKFINPRHTKHYHIL